jgi:hypothetical protein
MSFNTNDNNHMIHLGNYEEYFILYMDNELGEEQVKMVDEFLEEHPDLQAELQMLMATRLPLDEIPGLDKESLFSEHMKLSSVDEELLLFIDNELPADRKNIVALEIASNKNYNLQHHLLIQTKLDPQEQLPYPDKKELYRHTERVVYFKPWMRIAVALVILAGSTAVYFSQNTKPSTGSIAAIPKQAANKPAGKAPVKSATKVLSSPAVTDNNNLASVKNAVKKEPAEKTPVIKTEVNKENEIAKTSLPEQKKEDEAIAYAVPVDNMEKTESIEVEKGMGSRSASKDYFNNPPVTSSGPNPYYNIDESTDAKVASNEKGSVKGFLRKASKLIEKKTGISPVNDDGQLLIGVVAVKLK